eukprot:SAG31_NODE_37103_length_307_cov_0.750000_1_plen_76_part_01
MDQIEARLRATEQPGHPVFAIVYGLIDGNTAPRGLDAVDASMEMGLRLPSERFEILGAQEFAQLSAQYCRSRTNA